jgi:hypothetical protein
MRLRIRHKFVLLLTIAAASSTQAVAQTSTAPPRASSDNTYRAELAFGYTYVHSNAPPGGCGCFNHNGGNATFAALLLFPLAFRRRRRLLVRKQWTALSLLAILNCLGLARSPAALEAPRIP